MKIVSIQDNNGNQVEVDLKEFIKHINEVNGIKLDKITFLPNGADTNFLKHKQPDEKLLSKWDIRNKKVFLYVGTHAFYHGLDVIIEAASLLKNNQEILFLMVGDGPERKRIIKKAKDLKLTNTKLSK